MTSPLDPSMQRGATMIEVLVTMVILAFGLLGLAGLQARLQASEMEAYQRAQALILLNDMSSRITANPRNATTYVTGATNPLGVGMTCPNSTVTRAEIDRGEWCRALQGAGETIGGVCSNANSAGCAGAMVGGRGCIENLGGGEFLVTVAWQGLAPVSAPPTSVACGQNSYNSATTACVDDLCRRAITTVVRLGTLN